MALQSMRARRLILPWDDAGIEAGETEYLKIPDDVSPVLAWLAGQGPDKTHLVQVDSNGNLLVSISNLAGTSLTTKLVDALGNNINAGNPLPMEIVPNFSSIAIVSHMNNAAISGAALVDVIPSFAKPTYLYGYSWAMAPTSGGTGSSSAGVLAMHLVGVTTGKAVPIALTGYWQAAAASGGTMGQFGDNVMLPYPINLVNLFPGDANIKVQTNPGGVALFVQAILLCDS